MDGAFKWFRSVREEGARRTIACASKFSRVGTAVRNCRSFPSLRSRRIHASIEVRVHHWHELFMRPPALSLSPRREASPRRGFYFCRCTQHHKSSVLVKICRVDLGISTVPLKVYRFEDERWFKDNQRRRVDAKIDQVCNVLDIDVLDDDRRARRDRHEPRRVDHLFTWRLRLIGGC